MERLPEETVAAIVDFLPTKEFLKFTSTSRYYRLFRDELFWKRLVTERFAGPDETLYFPEDAGEDSMWKSLFEVQSKQRAKASSFTVVDGAVSDFLSGCWRYAEDSANVRPLQEKRTKIPKDTGATRDNTESGTLTAASVLSATVVEDLKERGMRHGDVVTVSFRSGPETEKVPFFYSSIRNLIVPRVIVESELVVPKEFQVIRDLPIRYWAGDDRATERVWCDLTEYEDEIRSNLVDLKGNGSLYRSHFVYIRDHTGHDNRYDVVFYQPSRSDDRQTDESTLVLDDDTLNRILDVGLFRFADADSDINGPTSPVSHSTLYFNVDELEMLEGELEL